MLKMLHDSLFTKTLISTLENTPFTVKYLISTFTNRWVQLVPVLPFFLSIQKVITAVQQKNYAIIFFFIYKKPHQHPN